MSITANFFLAYITTKNEDMQCVGIKKGKYHGVVYKYGKVSLGKENDDGYLPFKFEFDILDNNLQKVKKYILEKIQ